MARQFLARLKANLHWGDRSKRVVSILLPFLIISAGLGVLAWRSYQLSVRMERGAKTLAIQHAGYTAEFTARRVDAAVRTELTQAFEEWQQLERRVPEPNFALLQEWINGNEWVVSAIYLPDYDPTNSIYISEVGNTGNNGGKRLTREFFTSSGTVRYTYDVERLLRHVQGTIKQQPLIRAATNDPELTFQQPADVSLVTNVRRFGIEKLPDGFAFVAALGEPLTGHGVRAVVRTSYIGSGWENQRLMSLLASLIALVLTGGGAYLAVRGLRKEAETMKLRGALIANVSHELRTPLSMIRLGAETLKRSQKLKEEERHAIEDQILREVLHLSHLVENVLDVARIQHRNAKALAFTPVYPADLVEELVHTYASWIESKGFTVAVEIEEDVEEQMWDREAVSRALLNLIDNAIKYSADTKALEVVLRQTAEHVIIEVRDHGIGISQKDLARIFDPYYRATFSDTQTRRGAGLGLTLVQQIVASHGGRVEVDSVPGSGSTFRLLFPRADASEAHPVPRLIHAPEAF